MCIVRVKAPSILVLLIVIDLDEGVDYSFCREYRNTLWKYAPLSTTANAEDTITILSTCRPTGRHVVI